MAQLKPTIRRNFGKISFEGPFNNGWVNAIKQVIPHRDREMQPSKVWLFDPRHYAAVLYITKHYFGNNILDSTGGIAEPQYNAWKEKFDAWIAIEETHAKQRSYQRTERPPRAQAFDPYAVLYVAENAPPEVIRAAYRVLALKYHPDKGGDTERMKQINAAHDILKNQGKA